MPNKKNRLESIFGVAGIFRASPAGEFFGPGAEYLNIKYIV
jgi:hypothetical protein